MKEKGMDIQSKPVNRPSHKQTEKGRIDFASDLTGRARATEVKESNHRYIDNTQTSGKRVMR